MKLHRKFTITGYIESETEDAKSLLLAAEHGRMLIAPAYEGDSTTGESLNVQDVRLAAAYRALVNLEVKLSPTRPVREHKEAAT